MIASMPRAGGMRGPWAADSRRTCFIVVRECSLVANHHYELSFNVDSLPPHHSQFIRSDVHVLDVPSTAHHHCTSKRSVRLACGTASTSYMSIACMCDK